MSTMRWNASLLLVLAWLTCGWVPAAYAAASADSGFAGVNSAPTVLLLDRAEAARSDWNATAPPVSGWTQVPLMDYWDKRWPAHDGVVWYRLRWQQSATSRPTALLVEYLCMAGAVYVNGQLVGRDPNLVEPLSRTWIAPQYYLLPASVLRAGENTLLVRVSGLAAYQPGFGVVRVGDPSVLQARYRREHFRRYEIKLVNLAMSVVLGGVFLLMWLLRRQDTVYGWFAVSELTGSLYGANFIVTGTWPFPTTDGWQAFIAAMYMAAGASYAMFLLRFGERRFPRLERTMGVLCALALAAALFAPGWMGPHRTPWILLGGAFFYLGMGWFLVRAWRSRRTDHRVLAACLLIPILVSFYDFALYFGWVRGDTYLLSLTSILTLVGIGFVVSYRFVAAMRRVEGFNVELQREVAAATTELGDTLARQHALELAHSRADQRLQLVRDLHDGFGGTLLGAINQLERAPADTPKVQLIATLKEMRDDLRLVIDSTSQEQAELAAQMAPVRHRLVRLLETADIRSRWQLEGLDGIRLDSARSLDLLRLLQEAVTNVLKHSRAAQVDVRLVRVDDRLQLSIDDDGDGIGPAPLRTDGGAGLSSMRARAQRLGGELRVESGPDGTGLRLEFPLPA